MRNSLTLGFAILGICWLVADAAAQKTQDPKEEKKKDVKSPPSADPPATDAFASPTALQTSRPITSTPYMFGDHPGGGCGGIEFGGIQRITVTHPTFGCSRLNIAENGSPIPQDRVYFRYNHFHNQTEVDIFGDVNPRNVNSMNIDQFTFGFEKSFFDGRSSVEVRVPFARQLTSDIYFGDIQDTLFNIPMRDYRLEFNNVGVIAKHLLYRGENLKVSTGLAVNIPTGQDVHIAAQVENRRFLLAGPGVPLPPGTTGDFSFGASGFVKNSTVNLSPFLGMVYTPTTRFFTQGFAQFDMPLNSSEASFGGSGFVRSVTIPGGGTTIVNSPVPLPQVSGELRQQPLMRLNVGAGYWLQREPEARFLTGIAPTIEMHYTTTLEDARTLENRVQFLPGLIEPELKVGNLSNRIDVLNLTLGSTMEFMNRATVATGFVVPLRLGSDKPFDFEVIVQVNWRF